MAVRSNEADVVRRNYFMHEIPDARSSVRGSRCVLPAHCARIRHVVVASPPSQGTSSYHPLCSRTNRHTLRDVSVANNSRSAYMSEVSCTASMPVLESSVTTDFPQNLRTRFKILPVSGIYKFHRAGGASPRNLKHCGDLKSGLPYPIRKHNLRNRSWMPYAEKYAKVSLRGSVLEHLCHKQ